MILLGNLWLIPSIPDDASPSYTDISVSLNSPFYRVDIERRRHDTARINLYILNADGTAANIVNFSTFILSVNSSSRPLINTVVFQSAGTLPGSGIDGIVHFAIDAAAAANDGYFYYDIQSFNADGELITIAEGKYTVLRDRT